MHFVVYQSELDADVFEFECGIVSVEDNAYVP